MNSVDYFTSSEKITIARYVDENIPVSLKDWSLEYYNTVEQRLKTIFDEKLKQIQETANGSFNYSRVIHFFKLDEDCAELIKQIFLNKFQFKEIASNLRISEKGRHPVFELVNKDQVDFCMNVAWTPRNPYVYKLSAVTKEFQFERSPEKVLDLLWNNAKKGVDTDLYFSCGDKIFHAHSSILRTDFNDFVAWIENDSYNVNEKRVINIPKASANAFEQFLRYYYIGSLKDLVNNDNLDLLFDVFSVAHDYNHSPLMNHVVELLSVFFFEYKDNFEKNITKLLEFSSLLDVLDLMNFAVNILEKLDSSALINVLSFQKQNVFKYLTENVKESCKIIGALKTIEIVRYSSFKTDGID